MFESTNPPTPNPLIFLAEDDVDDQEFLIEALLKIDRNLIVHTESSGEKALNYLKSLEPHQSPSLIILDFNLPLISGQQILDQLQWWESLKAVPKVVWSTSNSPFYERLCLQSGASAYFVKPSDIDTLHQLARKMLEVRAGITLLQEGI